MSIEQQVRAEIKQAIQSLDIAELIRKELSIALNPSHVEPTPVAQPSQGQETAPKLDVVTVSAETTPSEEPPFDPEPAQSDEEEPPATTDGMAFIESLKI